MKIGNMFIAICEYSIELCALWLCMHSAYQSMYIFAGVLVHYCGTVLKLAHLVNHN